MSALRSLLKMYGALDQAVTYLNDPEITQTVERFLPGASANAGWYQELEQFFFEAAGGPESVADPAAALDSIDVGSLSRSQKSHVFYAGLANDQLEQMLGEPQYLGVTSSGVNNVRSFRGLIDVRSFRDSFVDALGPMASSDEQGPVVTGLLPRGGDSADAAAWRAAVTQEISEGISTGLSTDWAFAKAKQERLLDPSVPPMRVCVPAVIKVDGADALVVDTEDVTDLISLNEMKAVVNPYNWDRNYPAFFLDMAQSPRQRRDGWSNVIETVGFGGLQVNRSSKLKTALKFHVSGVGLNEKEARLDYDLDEPPGLGDGTVSVDRGYINMWAWNPGGGSDPTEPGVAIRTRKVVHINGLSPFAQARLIDVSGYGLGGTELLIEPALQARESAPDHTCREFDYSGSGDRGPSDQAGTWIEPGSHFAPIAVALCREHIRDTSDDYFTVADKWLNGSLSHHDLAAFGSKFSERLVTAPWRFLEAMNHPRRIHSQSGETGEGGST